MRMLAPNALLYTEMQTPGAIFHHPERALHHHKMEVPLALQLGGSDKKELVACAKIAEQQGFAEVNLNLGCPSDRVQAGRFGACLMAEPERVSECIAAMKEAVAIPVTAKTRIGIDQQDSYDYFASFAHSLINAGCDKLIVHARKAWLRGLSPKQNRTVPPLHYDYVYQIKQELPDVPVVINGNIHSLIDINRHLAQVDGVMLGRLACQNPYELAVIHHNLFPDSPCPSRSHLLQRYIDYAQVEASGGTPLSILIKPILCLAHGLQHAKQWKTKLIDIQQNSDISALKDCISFIAHLEEQSPEEIYVVPVE